MWKTGLFLLFLFISLHSSQGVRPQWQLPVLLTETVSGQLYGLEMVTFLANYWNSKQTYPFDVDINPIFTTSPAEAFYQLYNYTQSRAATSAILSLAGSSYSALSSSVATLYEIPMVLAFATSDGLSSKLDYPNVWRSYLSDSVASSGYAQFLLSFQWSHIIIFGSAEYSDNMNSYASQWLEYGITVVQVTAASTSYSDVRAAVQQIKESKINIVLVLSEFTYFEANAAEMGILGPKGKVILWATSISSNFPAMYGSLADVADNSPIIPFNKPENQIYLRQAYSQTVNAYSTVDWNDRFRAGEQPVAIPDPTIDELIWNNDHSTLDAIGFSLLMEIQKQVMINSPSRSQLATPDQMTQMLQKFSGTTSLGQPVDFDANQDSTTAELHFANGDKTGAMVEKVNWSPSGGFSKIGNAQWTFPDGTTNIPDDGIALEQIVKPSSVAGVISIILIGFVLICILVTLIIVVLYWTTPVMMYGSPIQLVIMLFGLIILAVSAGVHIGRLSSTMCVIRNWFLFMGYCTTTAALIAKTGRIFWIFRSLKKLKAARIPHKFVILATFLILVPQFLILIIRTSISRPYEVRALSPNKQSVLVFCGDRYTFWNYVSFGYCTLLSLVNLYLAYRVRNVPGGFRETTYIAICEYFTTFLAVFAIAVSTFAAKAAPLISTLFAIIPTLLICVIRLCLLFGPKLFIALIKPELNSKSNLAKLADYRKASSAPEVDDEPSWRNQSMDRPVEVVPDLDDEYA